MEIAKKNNVIDIMESYGEQMVPVAESLWTDMSW